MIFLKKIEELNQISKVFRYTCSIAFTFTHKNEKIINAIDPKKKMLMVFIQ